MKLIDAFCYFNEAELCTIRLNYYKDVVDYFVILESTHTWRGTRNEPNFMKNVWPNLTEELRAKIHHKVIDHPDEWLNEESWRSKFVQNKMRDSLVYEARTLMDGEDAYFAYNDLDEFWDRRRLQDILNALDEHRYVVCWQDYRIVYVDWKAKIGGWGGSRFATLSRLPEERPMSYGKFKYIKNKVYFRMHPIHNGWHFSYFGSADQRESKLKSIKDTRNWQEKKNMTYAEIAQSVSTVAEWNSVSRKRKQDAVQLSNKDLHLDPDLELLFLQYKHLFSKGYNGKYISK
jgi:beta-1,4-mannosyl-glycoprotein beta-1,4-N-acetylglucosaminyltransferase